MLSTTHSTKFYSIILGIILVLYFNVHESIIAQNGCATKECREGNGIQTWIPIKKTLYFLNQGLFSNLSTFDQFERRLSKLSKKECGDAFELFAEAYLNTQKNLTIKEVIRFENIPCSVQDELGIDDKDMGIDGLFSTEPGVYHAYQVKYRKNRKKLNWRTLSTFIGLADRVDQRMIFTNADELSPVIHNRVDCYAIKGNDLDRLEKEDFFAIEEWLKKSLPPQAERKKPREHQKEAIKNISSMINSEGRATALMACGTGKTLVSLWVAQEQDSQFTLVLLPSLSLVRQTLHAWQKATTWDDFSYLCVCSDHTVSQEMDEIIILPSDCDFPVTSKRNVVNRFLKNPYSKHKVIFSTYQSLHIVAQGMPKGFSFDLAIFDEAHKTASKEGTNYSFGLQDSNIPIKKRLFLTATPRHYDVEKKDKNGNPQILYSMDDPKVYGKICYNLSFGAASKKGIICDYKLIISVVTSQMVTREMLKRGEVIVNGDIVRARQVAQSLALANAIEKYNVNHILTFHNSIKSAEAFASNSNIGFSQYIKNFKIFHVNGAMRPKKRERIMKEFEKAPKALISNARCLTEGVDVPDVDMVAFMSPKKSKVDIVQAAGRAMRKSQSGTKECGYILIPLFVQEAEGENILEAFEKTRFDELWNVLQTMIEQDDSLAEIISETNEHKRMKYYFDDSRLKEKIEIVAPEIDLNKLKNAITTRIIETFNYSWNGMLEKLIIFKEKHGHCNVPYNFPENQSLSNWTHKQRVRYNQKKLPKSKIKKLEEIGFVWNLADWNWNKMFSELRQYKDKNNHCNVPHNFPENKQLSEWVKTQRKHYINDTLSKDKISRLEEIGFVWNAIDHAWEEKFIELCNFKEKTGHCSVPQRYPENKSLGIWVDTQRKKYNRHILPPNQLERLHKIGFNWSPFSRSWEEKFSKLLEFKHKTGHCDVPNKYIDNPSLGKWVHAQRMNYKNRTLSEERIKRLNEIGFTWNFKK